MRGCERAQFCQRGGKRFDVQVSNYIGLGLSAAKTGKIAAQREPPAIVDVHAGAGKRRARRALFVDVVVTDVDNNSTKELLYSIFLRATVAAVGQRRTGNNRHLFIKFACCSVSQIERIRRIWPKVPWVFNYRDPVETIVSNMQNLPTWLQDEDHRVLAAIVNASNVEVAGMSKEELCARSIAAFYTTAHRVANDRALLLNYDQLSPAEVANMLEFFGVSPTAAEMETIASQSRIYSKAMPAAARAFVADAKVKQSLATDLIREMAQRWANEPYQLLEHKRLGIHNHVN